MKESLFGKRVKYHNPTNHTFYDNGIIIHIVRPYRLLPKKFRKYVGHNASYTPRRRPYTSAVIMFPKGIIRYPKVNIKSMSIL